MFRYAIGNAERMQDRHEYYGWLDALAEQTHSPYGVNLTGPSIKVNSRKTSLPHVL